MNEQMNERRNEKKICSVGDKGQEAGAIQGYVISTLSPEDECSTVCDLTDAM